MAFTTEKKKKKTLKTFEQETKLETTKDLAMKEFCPQSHQKDYLSDFNLNFDIRFNWMFQMFYLVN